MIKKALSLAMILIGVLGMNAQMQQPQLTPLPLNPKVKSGVLPNGLSYYILQNSEPKERANFYIAQKVGSTLETPEQLGLAHFLEHMAFNGTEHYPGKAMLNYLQSKGIRFGADINAYTSFDETVYNINNVPTTDQALMDSVLLVLADWSGSISLETAEINAERGVIQEEWRQRNDANTRAFTAILPEIYDEYQYEQMPIGKMEVVMNFDPDVLRAYYKKWYRPDLQGIVIVGDFDADAMETKVKELFSKIPMPENAAPRVYTQVSDNQKPIYTSFEDEELRNPMITVSFKSDKAPFEMRNTQEMFIMQNLLQSVIANLINNRLSEFANKPECAYAYAGVDFTDFYVSSTKASFDITIIPKKDSKSAMEEAMAHVAQACKTGFNASELKRVDDEIIAGYEKQYNERDKTKSEALGRELIRHFIENEPTPGIEAEYQLVKAVLPTIPVEAINSMLPMLLTPENQVIVELRPKKEGEGVLGEELAVGIVSNALNAQYEAYVDEVITDPLISALPAPGSVKATSEITPLGATEFTLSNGVKVVLKTTDFAADEILFNAFREGGLRTYNAADAINVNCIDDAFETAKMGPFDNTTLQKYLAGKKVSLSLGTNAYTQMLNGRTTVKDLPTLMELIYAAFTALTPDEKTFNVQLDQQKLMLENMSNNPQMVFFNRVTEDVYNHNPLFKQPTVEDLNKVNYPQVMKYVEEALSNAADYTFIFTGNVDAATLKPLLEQYIATLPAGAVKAPQVVTPIQIPTGDINDAFDFEMQNPSVWVYDVYSGSNLKSDIANDVLVSTTADVLDDIYLATLREEMGGTYGAQVGGDLNFNDNIWQIFYFVQTNHEQKADIIKRAHDEWLKLLAEGAKPETFNKVKEAMLKQYEINVRTNSYWSGNIRNFLRGHDFVTGHKAAIESMTLDKLNAFMKTLYTDKNRIQVIMTGVEKK